jgi:hypothetical protein
VALAAGATAITLGLIDERVEVGAEADDAVAPHRCRTSSVGRMELAAVHDVHMMINLVHRFVYFVPEAAEEYAALGIHGRSAYFGSRAAPLGPVSDEVVIATFYNFSPQAVRSAMTGLWATAAPAQLQAARFRVVGRALERTCGRLPAEQLAEARAIVDRVVRGLDLAGKPLGAANAALDLPDDGPTALWQQLTVLREWRGDVHISVLVANEIGPCDCMVLQVGTGRFPLALTQASRQWSPDEWAESISRLADREWVDAEGTMTAKGVEERERIEADTDRLCAPLWAEVGSAGADRLGELITPVHVAMEVAGTYAAFG